MAGLVIVGAGQAAVSLAAKLRSLGDQRAITIIGDEAAAPYQRPPLTKAYLLGKMGVDRLELRGETWWDEQNVELLRSCRATRIDPDAKTLTTERGDLSYDDLVLATGATPRQLPEAMGGTQPHVHTLRNLADVDRLEPDLRPGRNLVVIGGGYIGLEAAAVARSLGLGVTLVEAAPRILGRVAAEKTADMIRDLHVRHGVELREGCGISQITGDTVVLQSGETLPADLVIVGIGVTPNTELAEDAGVRVTDGIEVDAFGRTSVANIWAVGDCANIPWNDKRLRLESVGHAIDMAEAMASNLAGVPVEYRPKPWFWSDQYNVKLQIAGLHLGHDRTVARMTDTGGSVWYFCGPDLVAVDALNDPRAYMVGKRLIESGRSPAPADISNVPDLKALL